MFSKDLILDPVYSGTLNTKSVGPHGSLCVIRCFKHAKS